jgi:hypothetical protein
VGQPFPVFQSIENSPGVNIVQEPIELPTEKSLDVDRLQEPIENSPGVDRVQEPIENSPGVDRVQEPIEFPDLESALAEIARLRVLNDKLLELARSQSEVIRKSKDISPVKRPSLCRVSRLAQAACLNVSKALTGGWMVTMGEKLKRGFNKLKEIWELLIADDWHLTDLFCPLPKEPVYVAPIFAPIHSRYSAIPSATMT